VVLVGADVSDERIVTIIRVTRICEFIVVVFLRGVLGLLVSPGSEAHLHEVELHPQYPYTCMVFN
jgi:hypothetical protein